MQHIRPSEILSIANLVLQSKMEVQKRKKGQQCYPSSSGKTDLFSSTYSTVCFRVGFNPVVIVNIALNVPFRSDCFSSEKLLLEGWLLA